VNITRAVLILALLTMLLAGGQALAWANAFAALGQKAEPNPQVPATPQANSGSNDAANASAAPQSESNATLQGQIQQALLNEPSLKESHISVNVTDSASQLSGTVGSGKDKQIAERIAESFNGNRNVEDKLVVTGRSK